MSTVLTTEREREGESGREGEQGKKETEREAEYGERQREREIHRERERRRDKFTSRFVSVSLTENNFLRPSKLSSPLPTSPPPPRGRASTRRTAQLSSSNPPIPSSRRLVSYGGVVELFLMEYRKFVHPVSTADLRNGSYQLSLSLSLSQFNPAFSWCLSLTSLFLSLFSLHLIFMPTPHIHQITHTALCSALSLSAYFE